MKKPLRMALILLILGGLLLAGYFVSGANQGPQQPGERFKTVAITHGPLEQTVASTGTLAAVETVDVGTEVSGTIEQLKVDYNDQVKQGQVLAILKQDLFTAAVTEAEAAVARAGADLALAERELKRNASLYEKGYLSEQEFLPYQVNAEKARASLASAQAELLRARTNLENTVIRSPIDGTVIDRSIDVGQTVAASLNTPTLFIIARNLQQMQIEADVDETDIGQIRPGQAVRFMVQSYPDQTFTGKVRQVRLQPQTVDNVVTYTVIVEAANAERLLMPGMTATVDFLVYQATDALLVPDAALSFQPGHRPDAADDSTAGSGRVFCLEENGRLRPVRVSTGPSDGLVTEVTAGELDEGMLVATGFRQDPADADAKQGFSLFSLMRKGRGPGPGPGGRP